MFHVLAPKLIPLPLSFSLSLCCYLLLLSLLRFAFSPAPITSIAVVVSGTAVNCNLVTFTSPFAEPPLLFLVLDHRFQSAALPPHAPAAAWANFVSASGFEACVAPLLLDPQLYAQLPVVASSGAGAGAVLLSPGGRYSPPSPAGAAPQPYVSVGPVARVSFFAIALPPTPAPAPSVRGRTRGQPSQSLVQQQQQQQVYPSFPAPGSGLPISTSPFALSTSPISIGPGYAAFEAGSVTLQPNAWRDGVQCVMVLLLNVYSAPPLVVVSLDHLVRVWPIWFLSASLGT
jgi:hypothetical protein